MNNVMGSEPKEGEKWVNRRGDKVDVVVVEVAKGYEPQKSVEYFDQYGYNHRHLMSDFLIMGFRKVD